MKKKLLICKKYLHHLDGRSFPLTQMRVEVEAIPDVMWNASCFLTFERCLRSAAVFCTLRNNNMFRIAVRKSLCITTSWDRTMKWPFHITRSTEAFGDFRKHSIAVAFSQRFLGTWSYDQWRQNLRMKVFAQGNMKFILALLYKIRQKFTRFHFGNLLRFAPLLHSHPTRPNIHCAKGLIQQHSRRLLHHY